MATSAVTRPDRVFLSLPEFEEQCKASPESYLIDSIVLEVSVNIIVGDSGLGKTPLIYQMGVCVASGVPFLGHAVRQGAVLYIDLENGSAGILEVTGALTRYLEVAKSPENFYLLRDREYIGNFEKVIEECKPRLVIIDSLRAFRPDAEQKNENAANLMNELRRIARAHRTAFLVIHHTKKPNDNIIQGSLENTPTMTWLNQACGARSLINQSDGRIGIEKSSRAGTLVVKGFARLRGEFGPFYLERVFDEEASAVGYRVLAGIELLGNPQQEQIFHRLAPTFSFKEAKHAYDRQDQATTDWLQKLIRIGVLTHIKGGLYCKVDGVGGVKK